MRIFQRQRDQCTHSPDLLQQRHLQITLLRQILDALAQRLALVSWREILGTLSILRAIARLQRRPGLKGQRWLRFLWRHLVNRTLPVCATFWCGAVDIAITVHSHRAYRPLSVCAVLQ
jgi:hypothetical protein